MLRIKFIFPGWRSKWLVWLIQESSKCLTWCSKSCCYCSRIGDAEEGGEEGAEDEVTRAEAGGGKVEEGGGDDFPLLDLPVCSGQWPLG